MNLFIITAKIEFELTPNKTVVHVKIIVTHSYSPPIMGNVTLSYLHMIMLSHCGQPQVVYTQYLSLLDWTLFKYTKLIKKMIIELLLYLLSLFLENSSHPATYLFSSTGVAWLYVPRPVYTITVWEAKEVSEWECILSWRQFQSCCSPVIAHTEVQTKKGKSPLAEQLFVTCTCMYKICIYCTCVYF